jgi:predicted transcriptional regulator
MKHLFLPIKPKYAEKILNGTKTVEVRKKYPSLKLQDTTFAFLYATSPVKAVIGYAIIKEVAEYYRETLWVSCGHVLGITSEEYDRYTIGHKKVTGIFLKNPKRLEPIGFEKLKDFGIKNFQSFTYVDEILLSLIKIELEKTSFNPLGFCY